MHKKLGRVALLPGLALGVTAGAFAQSKNFEGFGVSVGAASQQLRVKSSGGTSSSWKSSGNLELTHFTSLDENWLLGVGVGLSVGKVGAVSSGTSGSTFYDSDGGLSNCGSFSANSCYEYTAGSSKAKFAENVSLSVIPAYAFSKTSLGFVRMSFNSVKASKTTAGGGGWTENNIPVGCGVDPNPDCPSGTGGGNSGSNRLNGWGLGLGYRYQSDANWFVQAEYQYSAFRKSSDLDLRPTISGAVLSAGYKF